MYKHMLADALRSVRVPGVGLAYTKSPWHTSGWHNWDWDTDYYDYEEYDAGRGAERPLVQHKSRSPIADNSTRVQDSSSITFAA